MKNKLIVLMLAAALVLAGCSGGASENTGINDLSGDPVTTTAPVGTTTLEGDSPKVTPELTADQQPITTDKSPDTNGLPTTTAPGADSSDDPVPERLELPDELKDVAAIFNPVSGLTGDEAQVPLADLIAAATQSFENSEHRQLNANGRLELDKGIVTVMLGASAIDLELSYLTDGSVYELSSTTTTDTGKVTDDHQVYIDGWLYNTSVTTENGKQTGTDNYRVKMTQEEFSEYALSDADIAMNDLGGLVEMLSTAHYTWAGALQDGRTVVLAKGMMNSVMGSDDSSSAAISDDSFERMEAALVIGMDGNAEELYIHLPLTVTVAQNGIRFIVKGELQLKLLIDIPQTIAISAPANGSAYTECTVEEVYGGDMNLFRW